MSLLSEYEDKYFVCTSIQMDGADPGEPNSNSYPILVIGYSWRRIPPSFGRSKLVLVLLSGLGERYEVSTLR